MAADLHDGLGGVEGDIALGYIPRQPESWDLSQHISTSDGVLERDVASEAETGAKKLPAARVLEDQLGDLGQRPVLSLLAEQPPEAEQSDILFHIRLVTAILLSRGGPLLR